MHRDEASPIDEPSDVEDTGLGIPWHDYIPGSLLLAAMVAAFIIALTNGGSMIGWAVSHDIISSGELWNLQLHMFAHGSVIHIAMNGFALLSIGAIVVNKLGGFAKSWWQFLVLFEVCGLAGAATFLSIHQWDEVPMLGASGAIYGLLGFLVRVSAQKGEGFVPFWSKDMLAVVVQLLKDHFWLVLIFTVPPLLSGQSGGLAWEAHLGGFVAGLLIAPYVYSKKIRLSSRLLIGR